MVVPSVCRCSVATARSVSASSEGPAARAGWNGSTSSRSRSPPASRRRSAPGAGPRRRPTGSPPSAAPAGGCRDVHAAGQVRGRLGQRHRDRAVAGGRSRPTCWPPAASDRRRAAGAQRGRRTRRRGPRRNRSARCSSSRVVGVERPHRAVPGREAAGAGAGGGEQHPSRPGRTATRRRALTTRRSRSPSWPNGPVSSPDAVEPGQPVLVVHVVPVGEVVAGPRHPHPGLPRERGDLRPGQRQRHGLDGRLRPAAAPAPVRGRPAVVPTCSATRSRVRRGEGHRSARQRQLARLRRRRRDVRRPHRAAVRHHQPHRAPTRDDLEPWQHPASLSAQFVSAAGPDSRPPGAGRAAAPPR